MTPMYASPSSQILPRGNSSSSRQCVLWRAVYRRKLARRFLRVNTFSPRTAQTEVVFISICNRSGDLFAQELCALLERRNEMRPSNNTQNHARPNVGLIRTLAGLKNYHGMVCSFLTSREYQLRFGSVVTAAIIGRAHV